MSFDRQLGSLSSGIVILTGVGNRFAVTAV